MPRNGVTTADVPAVHQPRSGVGTTAKGRSASLRDKRAMLALKIFLPLAVVVWLFRVGIPGTLVPVWGPSMRPTMAVWHVPAPLESLSFSGWVHYDPDREPEIGNIVYFKVPNTRFREVKRVAKINEEGAFWVTPDNSGISGEGSDNSELYDWIPEDNLIGVVDNIYTPARFSRVFSSQGQLRNWVEMRYAPDDRYFGPKLMVVVGCSSLVVFLESGEAVLLEGEFLCVRGDEVEFESPDGRLFRCSSAGKVERLAEEPLTLSAEYQHRFGGKGSVGIEGNITDLVLTGSIMEIDRGEGGLFFLRVKKVFREGRLTIVEGEHVLPQPADLHAVL